MGVLSERADQLAVCTHDLGQRVTGHKPPEAEVLEQQAGSLDDVLRVLDAADAMPVKDTCRGCHGAKEAAILAALNRIRLCETAAEILDPVAERLRAALDRCTRPPRTSARSTSWSMHSSARAVNCPPTPGRSRGRGAQVTAARIHQCTGRLATAVESEVSYRFPAGVNSQPGGLARSYGASEQESRA